MRCPGLLSMPDLQFDSSPIYGFDLPLISLSHSWWRCKVWLKCEVSLRKTVGTSGPHTLLPPLYELMLLVFGFQELSFFICFGFSPLQHTTPCPLKRPLNKSLCCIPRWLIQLVRSSSTLKRNADPSSPRSWTSVSCYEDGFPPKYEIPGCVLMAASNTFTQNPLTVKFVLFFLLRRIP